VRQIYPANALLGDASLAALYAYPAQGPQRWIRANMVASLDGAATVRGRTGGLSGEADRQVFALLRALADVILVGAGTVRVEGYGPVRPESEGLQWAWLRQGRPPSAPVVTRRLHLDTDSPLIAGAPGHARTIVITTEAAPEGQRAAVSRTAEVIVAGETDVDLAVAADALVRRGYPHILTEGGPHLLGQIAGAGLLDELCLTVSPLVTGPGAGRIVEAMGQPDSREPRPLTLSHVIADDGYLLCRYLRSG
jgi:riboflavin biosynthesis pyrimidine reductase